VQSVNTGILPVQSGFPGKVKPLRPRGPTGVQKPIQTIPPQKGDQVRFGKIENLTGPIPPKSLVILVPGMLSPAESMRSLGEYLKGKGHTIHILESPYNIKAGSALASTDWLTHGIDRIRLDEASTRYVTLLEEMEKIPHEKRVEFLCEKLGLKRNPIGKATAQAALGLMFTRKSEYEDETDFTRLIIRLRKIRQGMGGVLPAETARKQLFSLSTIARNQLHKELLPVFMRMPGNLDEHATALEKTIDHVMDQIAPRVVLVGHSMGGFVSMLNLFEQMHDTAMVVGLAAPGEKGTDPIPTGLGLFKMLPNLLQQKGREFLESFGPGLAHMLQGSLETDKLKADHQPFNTTIFAVGMQGEVDGLVGENNFRMNDSLPGRVNVLVTPREANVLEMVSSRLHQLHQLVRWNPLYAWAEDYFWQSTALVKGIAHHCGLVQFQEHYWPQSGDIVRGVLEAPKNPEGKYDYQQGKPDYEEAVKQLRRLIAPFNYEAERLHFLNLLHDTLSDARVEKPPDEYQKLLRAYAPLTSDLEVISMESQPMQKSVADKALELLMLFSELKREPNEELKRKPNFPFFRAKL
jgi:hypothetical protein